MTHEHKRLVRECYATLTPVADLLGDIFYSRLFEVAPLLKHLFPADMTRQGEKLMAVVNQIMAGLDCMEKLEPAMEELGLRHASYGVTDRDYESAGQAMIWTLRLCLGNAFTADLRQAWSAFYAKLAAAMMRGAARRAIQS